MLRMHKSLITYYAQSNQYLRNTYILPKIIFNPSLILSPHVFLLGLFFTDHVFNRVDSKEVLVLVN